MHPQSFITGLGLVGAAFAVPSTLETRQNQQVDPDATSGNCADGVHVIAAGGANATNPYDYGLLGQTAQAVVDRIPGSSMVSLPYPKIKPRTNPQFLPTGIANLEGYVNSYHQACPDSKIAILGYSSGAVITMSAQCEGTIPMSLSGSTIIANVAYGDQTRNIPEPYNRGTCTSQPAKRPRPVGSCGSVGAITQSYCDVNDPECCSGPPEDYQIHLSYARKYSSNVADFVESQFQKLGGAAGGAGGSSSMSSSMIPSSMMSSMMSSSMDSSMMASSMVASSMVASSMVASSMMSGTATPTGMASSMASSMMDSSMMASSMMSEPTGGAVGGGAGGASSMVGSSMMTGAAPTMASSMVTGMASSAAAGASSAAASGVAGAGSATTGVMGGAGSAASQTPAPFDPNGSMSLSPSSALLNAACLGALVLVGAVLL